MRYSTLIGFLVALLKQLCTSEGGSTPILASIEVAYQGDQTLSQEKELPAAEMVPVVSPPSLKEVQQAVQEASEQVDGRGAEEVLKELLERVVEAAMGKAEAAGEAKDVERQKKVADGYVPGVITGQLQAEILEQPAEDKNISLGEGNAGFKENEGEAEVDAFEDVAVGEMRVVKGEGEAAARPIEKSSEGVEAKEAESLEVMDESVGAKFSQEDKKGTLEETEGDLETRKEEGTELVGLSVTKNLTKTEILAGNGALSPVEVEVDVRPEQETVDESRPGLGGADHEQIGTNWGKEATLKEESQMDKIDGEKIVLPSKDYEIKITNPVTGESVGEAEEVKRGEYAEGHEEDENGHVVEEGGQGKVEMTETKLQGVIGDERHGDRVGKEVSVALVNETSMEKTQNEEEEQTALENLHHRDYQETLVNPGLGNSTETFIERRREIQLPTPNPSVGQMEAEENTIGHEKSNCGKRIITSTHGFLPHNHGRIQPTLDDFDNDVLAKYHQTKGGKQGEGKEPVENTPGMRETNKGGLEAWKIGAIFAAVFLALETIVIIVYVIKCRNKKSASTMQRACEEGRVEPDAATGGDCGDHSRPMGTIQKITTLDPSDVASAMAQEKKQQEDDHAISLSKLSPSFTDELATTGPGPNFSQDLRTPV
nr:uncharacterized protein si:dkeyp-118a3.2 [Nothobranchius furzeri]